MKTKTLLPLFSSLITLFLTACSTSVYRDGGNDHGYWHLDGKLGIRTPQGADSVSISWKQCGNTYQVRLNSLIGTHVASIHGNDQYAKAQFSNQPEIRAESAESMIERELGWTLPVGALQHWLQAQPDSTPDQRIEKNSDGSIKTIHQQHWQVEYLRYHTATTNNTADTQADKKLPEKLRLKHDELTLNLLINNWRLNLHPEHCLSQD